LQSDVVTDVRIQVITSAVVISGLFIIFADWEFSQVLLQYADW